MPRSFDMSVDSPVSVDEILSAFGDEDYWQARLAAFDIGAATLDSLIVDADDTVAVGLRVGLVRDRLPKVITKLRRGDLEILHNQRWSRIDGDRVRGDVRVVVFGAPVSGLGEALLAPAQNGSRLEFTATVEVNVPLVGGTIESLIGGRLGDDIAEIQRFTSEWIAANR
jgi:Protein of unknown function (DUF2505)